MKKRKEMYKHKEKLRSNVTTDDDTIVLYTEGMNVTEVKGRGSQRGIRESYRGSSYCIDLIPKTRIEIIVKDDGVDLIVDAIKKGAYTGNIGDGKIFIYPIDNVIRIRTGEEGDNAV